MKIRKELWFGLTFMAIIVCGAAFVLLRAETITNGHLGLLMLALVVVAILFGLVENDSLAWPLLLVFTALLARAILVPPYRPTPKQVGIAEVAATVAVAATSLLL